jgi:hypothetical protein
VGDADGRLKRVRVWQRTAHGGLARAGCARANIQVASRDGTQPASIVGDLTITYRSDRFHDGGLKLWVGFSQLYTHTCCLPKSKHLAWTASFPGTNKQGQWLFTAIDEDSKIPVFRSSKDPSAKGEFGWALSE